jgi:hypothetical protein
VNGGCRSSLRLPMLVPFAVFLFHKHASTADSASDSDGQNAATFAKDRRAFTGRRGYMTHAGLAMMAVRARLGPA